MLALALLMGASTALAAQPARVDLEVATGVAISASLRIEAPEGSGGLDDDHTTRTFSVLNATGLLYVVTSEIVRLSPDESAEVIRTVDGPHEEVIRLHEAAVDLHVVDEGVKIVYAAGEGGVLAVEGRVEARGIPTNVSADISREVVSLNEERDVEWSWERGWGYLGTGLVDRGLEAGFPSFPLPVLRASGAIALEIHGGNLTVREGNGMRTIRLGAWSQDDAGTSTGERGVRRETLRMAVFEGRVADTRFPMTESWLLGAPRLLWEADGKLGWEKATGRVVTPRGVTLFEETDVAGEGRVQVAYGRSAAGIAGSAPYRAEGEWSSLSVGGRALLAEGLPVAEAATAAGLLALLAALLLEAPRSLLTRLLVGFYTRIASADLLNHPRRRAIVEHVAATGGVHLRDLHRAIGGGWGTFVFHVRLLEKGGYVRLEKAGKYAVVRPHARGGPSSFIGNPVARAIFDALPPAGDVVRPRDLGAALGLTRQHVNWHLRALAARGLIVDEGRGAARRVRRAPALGEKEGERAPEADARS